MKLFSMNTRSLKRIKKFIFVEENKEMYEKREREIEQDEENCFSVL